MSGSSVGGGVGGGLLGGILGGILGSREASAQSPIVMPQINIEIAGMDVSGGDTGGDDIMSVIMNGIMGRSNLFQGLGENMMDPVVVSLNLSSLRANTVLEYGVDGICAVCQDDISAVEIVRKIKKCGHKFHVDCVDKWFEGSVKCPECRWDVRDPLMRQEDVD
jgi:hypothetical protein